MNEAARRMAALSAEGAYNVTMDSPLLIRLLEFAREEARSDAVLHKLAERVATRGASLILGMDDYAWLVRGLGPDYPASEFDPSAATPPVPAPPPADVAEVAPVAVTAATKRWQVVATLEGQRVDVDVVEAADRASALEKARARYGAKVEIASAFGTAWFSVQVSWDSPTGRRTKKVRVEAEDAKAAMAAAVKKCKAPKGADAEITVA